MKHVHKKRAVVLTGILALLVCVGVVSNQQETVRMTLEPSEGYSDYEVSEIEAHDGEVLVDSINITGKEGTSDEDAEQKEEKVTDLVASDNISELKNADTYYDEVRASIQLDRNEIMSMLSSAADEAKDDAEKKNAESQKMKIIEYMNQEQEMEQLLSGKGFTNVLVLMTDHTVNVTVDKQELSQSDIAKITDIVMRETGRSADKIVIQSKF